MNQTNEFEKVVCIFCKTSAFTKSLFSAPDRINNIPGKFYLSKCQNCGLVFQDPRIKEEFISSYYPDRTGYYQPVVRTKNYFKKNVTQLILINFFGYNNLGKKNIFKKIILYPIYLIFFRSKSLPIYVDNGKLLEIGCSHGAKLEEMSEFGWETEGIEPNKKAADYSVNVRKLKVKNKNFPKDIILPNNYYDVVIMEMVIEHLHRPVESIQKISQTLKKGGQLIFSIPYFNGFEFKMFGRFSYGLHLPSHINFFNKNNIHILLVENFSDIKFNFHGFDRDFIAPFTYLENEKGWKFFKKMMTNIITRTLIIKPFILILSLFGLTSRVTVRARKK